MLSNKARPDLQKHQLKLRDWEKEVPERARRFHSVRQDLEARVSSLVSRWWQFWIADDELERLDDQMQRLERVADGLAGLTKQAARLEDEVRQLEHKAGGYDDPQLVDWVSQRCGEWQVRLQRVGANSDREPELFHEQSAVERIEEELRLHFQIGYWLQQASTVMVALEADPHGSARLAATLPGLKERLLREGASEAWLEELKAVVQPLQERAERIKDPPQQLQSVNSLLTDARGWSRQIGELEKEVQDLEQRHRFVAPDWTQDETALDQLLEEVRKLHERLTRRGQEIRNAKLREIEDYLGDLVQACGPQAGLEKKIAPLRELSVQRHQDHATWLKRYTAANDFFHAIAENEQAALAKRLGDLIGKLESGLGQLRSQPLSDRVRGAADRLEDDLERLRMLTGITETLKGLRQSKSLEERIEELDHQARQEKKDFTAQQESLRQRNAALLEQAARLGIGVEDASAAIEDLTANVAQLEAARRAAESLTEALEERRRRFVAECRERLAEHHMRVRAGVEILEKVGDAPSLPAGAEIDPEAAPQPAVDAVLAEARRLDELNDQLRSAIEVVDRKRREALAEIEAIHLPSLEPADREDAEQLLTELREGSWAFTEDAVERLRRLDQLVEKCALFFDQLRQEQMTAEARRETLRQRLRSFNEAQLRRFCPELTQRVTALVYGIPDQPRQWSAVVEQLDEAERVFNRLEIQARRLAARDLERARRALRKQVQSSADRDLAEQAGSVLAEIDRLSPHELPPAALRMRVRNLTPSWQEEE